MSNLDNIINKIIQDAEVEAKQILDGANEESAMRVKEAVESAKQTGASLINRAKSEESLIEDRVRTGIERESRDLVLQAKQNVINRAFELAKKELRELPDAEYARVLDEFLASNEISKSSVIEIPEDRTYQPKSKLKVEKNPLLRSGFRLQTEDVRISNDFEQIVDVIRESLEPTIGKMIAER